MRSPTRRSPGGMDEVRASSEMASTLLLRRTRWLGDGMSTGAEVEAASGLTGRGGGDSRDSAACGPPTAGTAAAAAAAAAIAAGALAGVEAGRGGGEGRASAAAGTAGAGAAGGAAACGAGGRVPGSEAGCEATLAGMEEAEDRETREELLPAAGRSWPNRSGCESMEVRREVAASTSNEAGRGTPTTPAIAGGSAGGGDGMRARSAAAAAAAATAPGGSGSSSAKRPCRAVGLEGGKGSASAAAVPPLLLCACSSALTVSWRSNTRAAWASDSEACGLICVRVGEGWPAV